MCGIRVSAFESVPLLDIISLLSFSLIQGRIQPVLLGVAISVIFGSQVS